MQIEQVNVLDSANEVGGYQEGSVTANELLAELKTMQDAFMWRLTKQKRIRGYLKDDAEGRVFDPVTAVAFLRTGEFFPEGRWTDAARSMGLLYSDCADVVAASNYDWEPSCRQGSLRHDLMDTLMTGGSVDASPNPFEAAFARNLRKRSVTTH